MSPVLKKTMHRRTIPAPPAIRDFIRKVLEASDDALPGLLDQFDKWTYPKGDMFQWVDVLNKFDALLETICKKYDLKQVQTRSFEGLDKCLLVSIIRFSVFLLDHCANRSLYASSNNINELLYTSDLDVLEQVCRISLRLAQRASHQRNGRAHFSLSQDKLWKLATSLQHATKEHGSAPLLMDALVGKSADVADDWCIMRYWYYKSIYEHGNSTGGKFSPTLLAAQPPSTPTPSNTRSRPSERFPASQMPDATIISERSGEGLALIELSRISLQSVDLETAMSGILADSSLPKEHHFELLLRLRFAKYVSDSERVQQLVNIRILSLATLAYIVSEPVLQSRLFSMEPNIVNQLAKLINPDSEVPQAIRASSFAALEAIAHHRLKLGDVLNALGASLSHGLLMYSLRKTFAEFESDRPTVSTDLIDALVNLLHYLSTTNVAGSMLCSAGLVQTLSQLIKNYREASLRALVKSLNLLDHLVYGFPQAFQIFCDTRGLDALVQRIESEVSLDISTAQKFMEEKARSNVDYAMTHERFSLLKTMLKFIVHMMQTSGTADGLRNLIETNLPKAMKRIYENTEVFGSSIFASTTNIMATFIHNEPASFQVLHEIGLPEIFLKAINQNILPASDALTAIPNAFGAICLNNQGLELFNTHNPLPAFMQIFTSAKHCETLRDSDIAGLLGSSIDELVRHHPSLKALVSRDLMIVMQRIVDLGRSAEAPAVSACRFVITTKHPAKNQDLPGHANFSYTDEDGVERPMVVIYIDVLARFLEGFLQNTNNTKEFIAAEGVGKMLDLYDIDALPYDFAKSHAALSLSHVLRLACEVNSELLLNSIFNRVDVVLQDLSVFIDDRGEMSFFTPYLAGSIEEFHGNALINKFKHAHSLCVLLSDLYAAPLVGHGRSALQFYQTFAANGGHAHVLHRLGELHRKVIWEDIKLSNSLSSEWVKATQPRDDTSWQKPGEATSETPNLMEEDLKSPRYYDLKMVRFFLCQMPPCIVPFFQGLSKMLIGRRGMDLNQRATALKVAAAISQILISHLSWDIPRQSSKDNRQSYLLMMLTVAQLLLCDDRSHTILITSLLLEFDTGVDQMLQILQILWADIVQLPIVANTLSEDAEAHTEQARVSGAMKLILHLFEQFTSSKAILESPQTLQLDSKERNKDKPDYFHPGELLGRMRRSIVLPVIELWNSPSIGKMPPSILRNIVVVLTQSIVVEARPPTAAHSSILAQQSNLNNTQGQGNLHFYNEQLSRPLSSASALLSLQRENFVASPQLTTSTEAIRNNNTTTSLYEICEETKQHAIERAIAVLQFQQDVVFDLADYVLVCVKSSPSTHRNWVTDGVNAFISTLHSLLKDVLDKRKSSYLDSVTHLLAKLVHDDLFYEACHSELHAVSETLVDLLEELLSSGGALQGSANLILTYDNLLAHQDSLVRMQLDHAGNLVQKESQYKLADSLTERVFIGAISLLGHVDSSIITLSILRFMVRLTRSSKFVLRFKDEGGLAKLLATIQKQIGRWDDNMRTTFIVLLRHLEETPDILRTIMCREIETWFSSKSRNADVGSFVKQNLPIALRDPAIFISATEGLCRLPKYDPQSSLQAIALRVEPQIGLPKDPDVLMEDAPVSNLSESIEQPPMEHVSSGGTITYILLELQRTKEVAVSAIGDYSVPGLPIDTASTQTAFKRDDHLDYLYHSLLLSSLTELLASYAACKTEFINYARLSRPSDFVAVSKNRTSMVTFFMKDMLTQNPISASETVEYKKKFALENLSRGVLVALCAETTALSESELIHIRKITLDATIKGLRDAMSSPEPIEMRYARVVALAELTYRLLSAENFSSGQQHAANSDSSHKDIARLMLEKNFVGIFTQALSDIDLQFPASRKIIKVILRPLRSLTKTSVRLSQSSEPIRPNSEAEQDSHEQTNFEHSDMHDDHETGPDREETPDLYRNSALGMFGAEIHESEDDTYSSDEDDEIIRYDDGLGFEEDGSETGSAVSDEDLDIDGDGHTNQHDVEIILDEDGDGSSNNSEDDSMSEDSDSGSSLSGDLELIDGDRDESDWHAEDDSSENDSTLDNSRPVEDLLHDLHGRLLDPAEAVILNDENDDDIDDVASDEEDAILQVEDFDDDDQLGDLDPWRWTESAHTDRSTRPANENIANRLWASLATTGRSGNLNNGPEIEPEVQIFRRPRLGGVSEDMDARESNSALRNPLLFRPISVRGAGDSGPSLGDNFSEWIESIEALIGGGAVQLIGDIMRRPPGAGSRSRGALPAIRLEVSGNQEDLIPAQMEQLLRRAPNIGSHNTNERGDDPVAAVSFDTANSIKRCQDEAVILHGHAFSEKIVAIIKLLLLAMVPAALEEGRVRKEKQDLAGADEPRLTTRPEPPEDEQAAVESLVIDGNDASRNMSDRLPESSETTMRIREPSTSMPIANRQTVQIHGQTIDITNLGIDLEFLEALPEDMREEVITQHVRERRATAQTSQHSIAGLTPEFLEALPAEIRAELIEQETIGRQRFASEHERRMPEPHETVGASDMDPASFLASLDPALRQSILVEQDEDFLHQLPSDMLAEVSHGRRASRREPGQPSTSTDPNVPRQESADIAQYSNDKPGRKHRHDAVQLLDKSGIAAILRLVFLPAPQRNLLHDVLLNLCENRANRAEVLGQLLCILQDGTIDITAAERCLHGLSKRAKLVVGESPVKTPKKTTISSAAHTLGAISPALIALQCLQALVFLLSWNEQLPSFFLTEHDLGSARRSSKGKSKLKEITKVSKYPINCIMMLLDRQDILGDSELLEPLSHLLSAISRPLLLLRKKQKESKVVSLEQLQPQTGTTEDETLQPISKEKNLIPPEIPSESLKLIVNIITADACSGKTFQSTLAAIHHLSALEGAGKIVSSELLQQAQQFIGQIREELSELERLIRAIEKGSDMQGPALSAFSSSNSYQAKFLRILKTIDYLFDCNRNRTDSGDMTNIVDAASLFETLSAGPLWQQLSLCLAAVHEKSDMIHVATVLLPLIEALMVVCKNAAVIETRSGTEKEYSPVSSVHLTQLFFNFTEEHRKILNQMVRNNPALMSGSFALLTKNPKVLEFDNKRNYFSRRVRDRGQHKAHYHPIQLNVRREAVFLDSYKDLHFKSGNEIKYSKLNIRFAGEEGIDAGGVSREWFQVLARQMFDPNYALFVPVNADRNTYHPNKTSGINPEHLLFFKFVGRIVGKALYDGRLLDCHFSRPVYRKILGKNVSLKDMETLDLEYYKSLMWMLENDITDVITETFSIERDDFGVINVVDLVPDGHNMVVTEQNKHEYVARVTEYRLLESVSDQLESFMTGFNEIIPAELVAIFNEQELELLISGLPDIDADDWKNNTEYHNYTPGSPQIQWFWRVVRTFDDEERARLLQFCTGSSRIPIEGFAHLEGMHGVQKFNIHRDYSTGSRLPQSHTCFNQLDLPEYESYDVLRSSILTAISEGSEGFGFA